MTTFGIYEKALPKGISWQERLELAASLGFDFVEMSIDETDERLARLQWTDQEIEAVNNAQQASASIPSAYPAIAVIHLGRPILLSAKRPWK